MHSSVDNCDDEAICLAKAAKLIHRDMLGMQAKFDGSFSKGCQEQAVPKSLEALVAMIMDGPNIMNKVTEQSLALSQEHFSEPPRVPPAKSKRTMLGWYHRVAKAPLQNGACESLIKSVKRYLCSPGMKEAGGFSPKFCQERPETFCDRNIDLRKHTDGARNLPGTVVSFFQQDKDGEFVNRPLEIPKSSSKKPLAFDVNWARTTSKPPLGLWVYKMGKRKIFEKRFHSTGALANPLGN
ncbi:hypothetical protein GWK47_050830 [Chionoecetes opilio]|uniref:Uncharacterized protein n=1 Tax=Chionoecetes opilio TaxID=41210 RepID=A0A8J5CTH7_CHIOP|nr:hypothetical protein GWK47_050830 [Chionoecetes opilio]